jgi:hypothetical protein
LPINTRHYTSGFNDREIVALIGAHALGRCYEDRSGYKGPWTRAPTTFSNEYFVYVDTAAWGAPYMFNDVCLSHTWRLFESVGVMAEIVQPSINQSEHFRS